jgi:hypothetical protein
MTILVEQVRQQLNEHIELQPKVAALFNWGDVKPDLPKFERLITIKYGKRVSPDTQLEKIQKERYKQKVSEGKARNIIDNSCYSKELTEDASGVIRGVVASFDVASTHNGSKLLISIIKSILYDMPFISSKAIELDYRLSPAHSRRYLSAIKILLPILSKPENHRAENSAIKNPYESMI